MMRLIFGLFTHVSDSESNGPYLRFASLVIFQLHKIYCMYLVFATPPTDSHESFRNCAGCFSMVCSCEYGLLAVPGRLFCFGSLVTLDVARCYL